MKKTISASLKVLVAAIGIAGVSAASAAGFTMKIAHSANPGESRDLGAHRMADLLNGKNSCDLKVQVYPSSQLGGSNDMIQLLQLGSVESTLLPASFLVGFQPLLGIMDLPYYFPDDPQKLLEIHKSQAMKDLLDTTTSKGIVSLNVWHTGYKEWTGPRPMVTPEDYRGLTARVMPSQVLVEQNRLLGLQNVSMNFGETYSALQNGAIQAQDNPITLIQSMKFYEVQKYMTMTDHGTLDQVFMVSKKWWDQLPESCQGEIREAADAAAVVSYETTQKGIEEALKVFKSAGMEVVPMTAEQKAVLAEVTKPTRDFYVKLTKGEGQTYLDAFDAELAEVNK
ncbi:TRAP transporter substrate-binding protein [Pusillimonas sp.]|uniref:TRAP transporter substrate-binding protein n=1 Tax=Pusillimonas sp. TaxID=3040095 RepID=UPI0037C91DE7